MFDPMSPEVLLEAISLHGCRRAELALSTASVEPTGEWAAEGAVSFTGWLRRQARMSIGDARQLCAEGRWLSSFPAVAAAVVAGRISWSQVGIMMLAIRQPHRELFADHSPDLIEAFHPLDINDTIAAMKDWRDKADAILDIAPKELLPNGWRVRELDEGGLAGHFVVGAEIANELLAALETARTTHADDVRSPAQRTADAAGAVFAFFNANHDRSGTPRHRPHVELIAHTYPELEQLIVDGAVRWPDPHRLFEALAAGCVTTLEGSLLPDWTADMYLCDCVVHRVLAAGSTVAVYGRKTRTVPVHLFRRVALRDGGCRFPRLRSAGCMD